MSAEKHPTISMAVPTYSYLIDIIEDFLDDSSKSANLRNAARIAKRKLEEYYPTTSGLVYNIGTGITTLYNLIFLIILIFFHSNTRPLNCPLPLVLDPRLKMEYYNEHGFQAYIKLYKKQITDLWKTSYLPTEQGSVTPVDETRDDLFAHVFKKRKIVRLDELDFYLKDDLSDPFNTHVLMWWKVNI